MKLIPSFVLRRSFLKSIGFGSKLVFEAAQDPGQIDRKENSRKMCRDKDEWKLALTASFHEFSVYIIPPPNRYGICHNYEYIELRAAAHRNMYNKFKKC